MLIQKLDCGVLHLLMLKEMLSIGSGVERTALGKLIFNNLELKKKMKSVLQRP